VHIECVDSSGGQVHPAMSAAEFLSIDRGRIHALTGPFSREAPIRAMLQIMCSKSHIRAGLSSVSSDLVF